MNRKESTRLSIGFAVALLLVTGAYVAHYWSRLPVGERYGLPRAGYVRVSFPMAIESSLLHPAVWIHQRMAWKSFDERIGSEPKRPMARPIPVISTQGDLALELEHPRVHRQNRPAEVLECLDIADREMRELPDEVLTMLTQLRSTIEADSNLSAENRRAISEDIQNKIREVQLAKLRPH